MGTIIPDLSANRFRPRSNAGKFSVTRVRNGRSSRAEMLETRRGYMVESDPGVIRQMLARYSFGMTPELITVVVALVPALGALLVAFVQRQSRPRIYRRLSHQIDMLAKAPDESESRKALDKVVVQTINAVSSQDAAIRDRKINPFAVTWTVIFTLGATAAMYGLSQWVVDSSGGPWAVIAWVVTVLVALAFVLLLAASITTWYNPVVKRERNKPGP